MPSPNSAPPPVPISFKRVALSLCLCALIVAILNLYMNLIATYGMSSMQLDLSADGDVIGFHQFDLDSKPLKSQKAIDYEAGEAKLQDARNRNDLTGIVVRSGNEFRQIGKNVQDDKGKSAVTEKRLFCPGLCPPSRIWPRTQDGFVKALIDRQMRNLPINTFLVELSTQKSSPGVQGSKQQLNSLLLPEEKHIKNFSVIWQKVWTLMQPRSVLPLNLTDRTLREIIAATSSAKIESAVVPKKGTQLKAAIKLQGNQWAFFKPKRHERDAQMPTDTPYSGADRHNAEIAAFYLSRILGINRVPIAVGRKVGLGGEILPVSDTKLQLTFVKKQDRWCFYGVCMYCNKGDPVCEDDEGFLEGTVILMLPAPFSQLSRIRSPWARTYDSSKSAPWESRPEFCETVKAHEVFGKSPMFLDLMDMAIFDWLLGNADRHRLEIFDTVKNSGPLLLDNGKSFGNHKLDEITILAPIYQCCKIRKKTYSELNQLSEINLGTKLDEMMRVDPIYPILTADHLEAINRRLRKVVLVLAACIEQHGEEYVLQDDGF